MRRQFVLAVLLAAIPFAVLWAEPIGLSETPPVGVPDWLSEPAIPACPPPHWIPKQPGHYSLTDWHSSLRNPTGRKVAGLHPGLNDVRAVARGVYFIRKARAQNIHKVVVEDRREKCSFA